MLKRLEGPRDDDVFAPKEEVNTMVAIVSSLIFKVKHTTSKKKKGGKENKRKEKLIVKNRVEKGNEIKNINTNDNECGRKASKELVITKEGNKKSMVSIE